mgnify:CR=1 FL=1
MKITKSQLRQLIKEELSTMAEVVPDVGSDPHMGRVERCNFTDIYDTSNRLRVDRDRWVRAMSDYYGGDLRRHLSKPVPCSVARRERLKLKDSAEKLLAVLEAY